MIKLWIDDVRPAPEGYVWCHSTFRALKEIYNAHNGLEDAFGVVVPPYSIEIIDLDHDSGEYFQYGGDYIEILKELERLSRTKGWDFSYIKFRLHSANPVGVQNMRAIIEKNGWKEIK